MTVSSGFYNSLNNDRRYDAAQMGSIFDGIIQDGVYQAYGSAFQVLATTGNTITVGTGRAWYNHTWLLNDALLTINMDSAEAVLHRYDEIVIEVNSTDAVRANTIKVVKGSASSTPSRPTLTRTPTVNQYSLATVYRAGGSTVITQGNITNRVGTLDNPYSSSILTTNVSVFSLYDNSGLSSMHRNVFRGFNLGSSLTSDQKTVIQNGTFAGLWLGDYWVIGGVNWRIVDIDYWYGLGDTPFNTHHLVIMPDNTLYNTTMNNSSITDAGYGGSLMRSTNLNGAKTTINAAFPSAVLTRRDLFSSSASNGNITNYNWYSTTVEIPSETMMFGNKFYGTDQSTISTSQLSLFATKPSFIRPSNSAMSWLNNVNSADEFAGIHAYGNPDFFGANESVGVRPVFAIGV